MATALAMGITTIHTLTITATPIMATAAAPLGVGGFQMATVTVSGGACGSATKNIRP